MLSLFKVVPGRIGYYLEVTNELAMGAFRERDGYWRVPGRPFDGASVPVLADECRAFGRGEARGSNRVLNPNQSRVRFCGIDATFTAPKTVSLLHAIGGPDVARSIELAHRESLHEVLEFLDRRVIVVHRSVGPARISMRATTSDQMIFEHRTSRALDPHLHSHVLIPNVATPDGLRWSAIDSRPVYFHSLLLGTLQQSSFRARLSATLGVRWRAVGRRGYDIEGLAPAMVRVFSQRRGEIDSGLAGRGLTSPAARSIESSRSRPARDFKTSYEELQDSWQRRAYGLGISAGRLCEMTDRRQASADERQSQLEHELSLVVSAHRSVTLASVLDHLGAHIEVGATIAEIESVVEAAARSGALSRPSDLWPFGPLGHRAIPSKERVELAPGRLHGSVARSFRTSTDTPSIPDDSTAISLA